MKYLRSLDNWHHTKLGRLCFAMAELAMAYGFASLAIDRGNLAWYALALIFFIGFLQNSVRFIGAWFYANKKS